MGAGTEVVGLSFAVFSGILAGSWTESRSIRIQVNTLIWDMRLTSDSLNHCATMAASGIFKLKCHIRSQVISWDVHVPLNSEKWQWKPCGDGQ